MEPSVEKYVEQIPWYFKGEIDYIDGWLLMRTPFSVLMILSAYLVFILKIGPAFMEKRPAFKLRIPLLIYNAVQVLYSMFLLWATSSVIVKYGLVRQKCTMDVPDVRLATTTSAIHFYFLGKVSELLDTVFFVLRKKKNQITFLHVYHHVMMVGATWLTLKYDPSYILILIGAINSFVHILMYGYYGLSTFPSLDKYLWWKKYLTVFQLIQFGIMLVHLATATAMSECTPSYSLLFSLFFNVLLMIYLFSGFYLKEYVKKEKNCDQEKSKTDQAKLNANGFSHRNNKVS